MDSTATIGKAQERVQGAATASEVAYAKVNLALHVRSRLPSDYHRIETLYAFVAEGDLLSVTAPAPATDSTEISLAVRGDYARELAKAIANAEDNLVLRAVRGLQRLAGVRCGAQLTLDKRLPIAAGLGGGSADAAAAMRLLSRFWGLDLHNADLAQAMRDLARDLGADVPACLLSRSVRGDGIGERLAEVNDSDWTGAPILLVHPNSPDSPNSQCPTATIFAGWDGVDRGGLDVADWKSARNDLTVAACAQVPAIRSVLNLLAAQRGATFVRMSGSGATCFALFDSPRNRDLAHSAIAEALPQAWLLASRLR